MQVLVSKWNIKVKKFWDNFFSYCLFHMSVIL